MSIQNLQTYTVKEAAKIISVPTGTLKRWEQDFADFLIIPRTKQGARYFTELEMELLTKIKQMRDNNISLENIISSFQPKSQEMPEMTAPSENFPKEIVVTTTQEDLEGKTVVAASLEDLEVNTVQATKESGEAASLETGKVSNVDAHPTGLLDKLEVAVVLEGSVENKEFFEPQVMEMSHAEEISESPAQANLEDFFKVLDSYKDNLIEEVKMEIRNGIRKEVLEEVKKEIKKGSVQTVKNISDSIYKSSEHTQEEIRELSGVITKSSDKTSETIETIKESINQSSEQATETFYAISKNIAVVSRETSNEISTLANRISDSSDASAEEFKTLIHYISEATEVTNQEIGTLVETLNKDREFYLNTINKELDHIHEEIHSREEDFKNLVVSFRQTATTKAPEKKWWKFWD